MAKKRLSVLDQLTANSAESNTATPAPAASTSENKSIGRRRFDIDSIPTKGRAVVDPNSCRLWEFADRPISETLHLESLASSFKEDGQIAPCIVRPVNDPNHPEIKYEVIAGQVRWRAAKKAGMNLDVVIKDIDDEKAFRLMVAENEQRKDLSDYAKALRFKRSLEVGIYPNKTALANAMGLKDWDLSYYLKYADIPNIVIENIKDIYAISVRWGYELASLCEKGYTQQLISLLPQIEAGEIRQKDIVSAVTSVNTDGDSKQTENKSKPNKRGPVQNGNAVKYKSRTGQHLFSLRTYEKKGRMLSFPKDLDTVINDEFLDHIKEYVEQELAKLEEQR